MSSMRNGWRQDFLEGAVQPAATKPGAGRACVAWPRPCGRGTGKVRRLVEIDGLEGVHGLGIGYSSSRASSPTGCARAGFAGVSSCSPSGAKSCCASRASTNGSPMRCETCWSRRPRRPRSRRAGRAAAARLRLRPQARSTTHRPAVRGESIVIGVAGARGRRRHHSPRESRRRANANGVADHRGTVRVAAEPNAGPPGRQVVGMPMTFHWLPLTR